MRSVVRVKFRALRFNDPQSTPKLTFLIQNNVAHYMKHDEQILGWYCSKANFYEIVPAVTKKI